jgi:hypothetical protein
MPVIKKICQSVVVAVSVLACSPTLNWRDVRPEGSSLGLLLPCKPEKAEKLVPLGSSPTTLRMLGCDAGGLTFAISAADVGSADQVPAVLQGWQQLTLTNMKAAKAVESKPLKLAGATGAVPIWVIAKGQRADGTPVVGHAAYFAQGATVFQAVIYGAEVKADVAETYFSGLKFD